MFDEKIYEQVARELSSGIRREGLWAKAVADCQGNVEKAKALYINYRAQAFRDEFEIRDAIARKATEESVSATLQYDEKIARELKGEVEEIIRRFSFLEERYPGTAAEDRVKAAIRTLRSAEFNNGEMSRDIYTAIVDLDAALSGFSSVKAEIYGTLLQKITAQFAEKII